MTRETVMILAAGKGTRLWPLTKDRPKAMVPVLGRPLIDRILERIEEEGLYQVVVNTHYKAEVLEAHLDQHPLKPFISREDELLETGGGIKKALPHLGADPFFSINCDSLWLNSLTTVFSEMRAVWDPEAMDALLLLYPTIKLDSSLWRGDFTLDAEGRLARPEEGQLAAHVYTGIQLLHPRLFKEAPDGPFSLNVLYDQAIESGRLYGLSSQATWFHVSTPEDVSQTEAALRLL